MENFIHIENTPKGKKKKTKKPKKSKYLLHNLSLSIQLIHQAEMTIKIKKMTAIKKIYQVRLQKKKNQKMNSEQ